MIHASLHKLVYEITLDRADQRNALTPTMSDALVKAIAECPADARALLLVGNGPVFCAGFDLPLCQQSPDGSVLKHLLRSLSTAIMLLKNTRCPVVIAAQGGAIAGGCALLTAADHVVSDSRAKFGYPVHRLGLSPAVSIPTLAQTIGNGAVRPIAFDTQLIDGRRGREISLIHTLVETAAEVIPSARAIAAGFAEKPPQAMTETKAWLSKVSPLSVEEVMAALTTSLNTAGTDEQTELLRVVLSTRQKP